MTFMVPTGTKEEREATLRAEGLRWLGVHLGASERRIPLNGGSQTRRDMREDWQAFAQARGLACEAFGHVVIIRARRGAAHEP